MMAKSCSIGAGRKFSRVRVVRPEVEGGSEGLEMESLTARLRTWQLGAGTWLRTHKVKALILFLGLNVLSGTARTSLDGVPALAVSFVFMFLAILVAATFLQGGRRS